MYVNIDSVTYDAANEVVEIQATSLDEILLNSWEQEFNESANKTFRFDLKNRGARIYLFKICKSLVKKDCSSMVDMLNHLNNKITSISANFLADETEA